VDILKLEVLKSVDGSKRASERAVYCGNTSDLLSGCTDSNTPMEFRAFPKFLQANVGIVPRLLTPTFLPFYRS
jgi:hypothetical protein